MCCCSQSKEEQLGLTMNDLTGALDKEVVEGG